MLKEYEKTISELIADKERDKKALEAEVQLFSLMIDFCLHGNPAFIGFFLQVLKMQQEKEQAVEDLQVNKDIDLFRKKNRSSWAPFSFFFNHG